MSYFIRKLNGLAREYWKSPYRISLRYEFEAKEVYSEHNSPAIAYILFLQEPVKRDPRFAVHTIFMIF